MRAKKTPRKRRPAMVQRKTQRAAPRKWSARVMARSDALDIETRAFTRRSPRAIALSLKRSALRSRRRKAGPFQSAMSMLNFYINRGGKGLSAPRKRILEKTKEELRKAFGRS
jgi:hypothetical protein